MSEAVETPGPRLRRERERQGLSVQKTADEMHLDTWVIEALESDTYARVGPAVYARGHLRKYAALLGLPPAEIVAGYEALQLGDQQPQAANVRALVPHSGLHNLPWAGIAGTAIVVLLVAGILWWQPWQQRVPAVAKASPAAETPAADVAAGSGGALASGAAAAANDAPPPIQAAEPAAAAAPASGTPGTAPTEPQSAAAMSAPAQTSAAPGAPELGAGHARLRMSFSADSWVDVRDAKGKRVFAGNGRANSVKSLAGEAPLRVYLGFASGVQLEINERAVAIGPQFVNGDVARFEAGADGILRRDSHNARPHG